jgi:hypothetical protein
MAASKSSTISTLVAGTVNAMDLSLPAKIHVAVPANQVCGAKIVSD